MICISRQWIIIIQEGSRLAWSIYFNATQKKLLNLSITTITMNIPHLQY